MTMFVIIVTVVSLIFSATAAIDNDTIQVPLSTTCRGGLGQIYYFKYQSEDFIYSQSDNFQIIPKLEIKFYLVQPTLFKITFQGRLYHNYGITYTFIQVVVNGNLIIGNKVIPNTVNRGHLVPTLTYQQRESNADIDRHGGHYYFESATAQQVYVQTGCTRIALVYLAPGTLTFNVGIRSSIRPGTIGYSVLMFEATQIDPNANINMPLITFTSTSL
ncbi:unnamed protein product [Didymodactylos carnosus]|uniref:Uncharacterized protein n=1 Tax=Didymodactylos carnosus TaxID=1234261 RepID=A0A815VVU3_9BILA|nr:unnamed protein product [Didymodactylos carnosus]CAF1540137.1 unnamed protein product [Didymodactylos carnosus]CAF4289789.1 unnamed protein product [Didymodactylos carnosus]CAF4400410.1 unnamed protein product [Didymodactylos carnosus]